MTVVTVLMVIVMRLTILIVMLTTTLAVIIQELDKHVCYTSPKQVPLSQGTADAEDEDKDVESEIDNYRHCRYRHR